MPRQRRETAYRYDHNENLLAIAGDLADEAERQLIRAREALALAEALKRRTLGYLAKDGHPYLEEAVG